MLHKTNLKVFKEYITKHLGEWTMEDLERENEKWREMDLNVFENEILDIYVYSFLILARKDRKRFQKNIAFLEGLLEESLTNESPKREITFSNNNKKDKKEDVPFYDHILAQTFDLLEDDEFRENLIKLLDFYGREKFDFDERMSDLSVKLIKRLGLTEGETERVVKRIIESEYEGLEDRLIEDILNLTDTSLEGFGVRNLKKKKEILAKYVNRRDASKETLIFDIESGSWEVMSLVEFLLLKADASLSFKKRLELSEHLSSLYGSSER